MNENEIQLIGAITGLVATVVGGLAVISTFWISRRGLRSDNARGLYADCREVVLDFSDALFHYAQFSRDVASDRLDKAEHARQSGRLVHCIDSLELTWGHAHPVAVAGRDLMGDVRDLLQDQLFQAEHPDGDVRREIRDLSTKVHDKRDVFLRLSERHLAELARQGGRPDTLLRHGSTR